MKMFRVPVRILLSLLALVLLGCTDLSSGTLIVGGGGDDDDSIAGDDDDTAPGDDDTASGDDDTASGDDDTASGDDDTASGDDDTAGPHQLTGKYEGEFLMSIDFPGPGSELEEACAGEVELDIEPDGSYRAEAECEAIEEWPPLPDFEFVLTGTVSDSLQFEGDVTGTDDWTGQVSHTVSTGFIKAGFIKLSWEGVTPGQGQTARDYAAAAWMEVD